MTSPEKSRPSAGPVSGTNVDKRRAEAAERALAEAEERRRRLASDDQTTRPRETGGQTGPDPARYGDWEKDGIVSDF